jgi:hypothetical protein
MAYSCCCSFGSNAGWVPIKETKLTNNVIEVTNNTLKLSKLAQAEKLLSFVREVLGSIYGRDTDYSD